MKTRLLLYGYLTSSSCDLPPSDLQQRGCSRTASRRADRPSKPDMPTTGIGHSGAQAIVPDRGCRQNECVISARRRVHGQPGLTFADARLEWRGHPTRAALTQQSS